MKKQGRWIWFLVFFLFCLLAGCSGSGDSDDIISGGESIYDPGVSVGAMSYADAYGISMFVLNDDGEPVPIQDGDYIEPGKKTFGLQIEGDPANIDRVFFSDGGIYQVEALMQDDMYAGDFEVSEENLYQPLLVHVIHNNGLASKEKIVLRTFQHHVDSQYVKNGVGLLIAQEILDGQRNALAESLDDILRDVFAYIADQSPGFISGIGYGDSNPDKVDVDIATLQSVSTEDYPRAVLQISLVVRDVDLYALPLYGQNLISTVNNDLFIDFFFSIDDKGTDGSIRFILDFSDPVQMRFARDFFLKDVVLEMLKDQLTGIDLAPFACDLSNLYDEITTGLPNNFLVNGKDVDLNILFDGLVIDLNKYLFADIYGIPEDTSAEAMSLGMGLYVADYDDVIWESYVVPPASDPFDMEEIFEDICKVIVQDAFEDIRQEYEGLITELSYGDGDSGTPDFVVNSFILEDTTDVNIKNVRINYTIKSVDLQAVSLFGFALISTQDNDLTVASSLSLEHRISGTDDVLVIKTTEISNVSFAQYFIGREIIEDIIKSDLESMEDAWFAIEDLMQDMSLDIDITTGLYSGCDVPLFPDVSSYITEPAWELILPEAYNVACAISQNNINWVMESVLNQGVEWDVNELLVALLGEDFEGFNSGSTEGEVTVLRLSVPPVVDVRASQIRVLFNDVILQYRIDGEPQWEASIDLDMIVEVRAENSVLGFYLTQIPQNTHFHIMRDNPGNLGIFDHSTLVNDIIDGLPEILGLSEDDPIISIGLDAFSPFIVFEDVLSPVTVRAGGGYLYIDMALSSLDLEGFFMSEKRCE